MNHGLKEIPQWEKRYQSTDRRCILRLWKRSK